MALLFEWDEQKASQNLEKHGVSFEEAATVFGDPLSLTIADSLHSTDEERYVIIGQRRGHGGASSWSSIRSAATAAASISAREATPRERRSYEHDAGQPGPG